MGELDAGIKCVEFVHWRVNISEGFVEGTKRIEMIWAAEEYHLRCVIYGHYRELYQLRAQKNATEDEMARVLVQDAIFEVHRVLHDKYNWVHDLCLWR